MKYRMCALAIASLAGGCDNLDPGIRQAKAIVRENMRDPGAAEFRNVQKCPTGFYVTGEVNGKNAYGAYVGFRTFYANSAGSHIVGADEYADEDDYRKMCFDQKYKDAEINRIEREANAMVANSVTAE